MYQPKYIVRFKLQIYVVSASDFIEELEPAWSDTVVGIIYDEYLLSLMLNSEKPVAHVILKGTPQRALSVRHLSDPDIRWRTVDEQNFSSTPVENQYCLKIALCCTARHTCTQEVPV